MKQYPEKVFPTSQCYNESKIVTRILENSLNTHKIPNLNNLRKKYEGKNSRYVQKNKPPIETKKEKSIKFIDSLSASENKNLPLSYPDTGKNIILTHCEGEKEFLIFAHYDAVKNGQKISPGANDNASSVAVAMDVYEKISKVELPFTCKIIFSGDEEPTKDHYPTYGSRAYIHQQGYAKNHSNLLGVISLELCGMGDMVGAFPIENKDSLLAYALTQSCKKNEVYFESIGELPELFSDEQFFHYIGFKEAYCIMALPSKDKQSIIDFVETDSDLWSLISRPMPEILQRYHCFVKQDESSVLYEESLNMMSLVTVGVLEEYANGFK